MSARSSALDRGSSSCLARPSVRLAAAFSLLVAACASNAAPDVSSAAGQPFEPVVGYLCEDGARVVTSADEARVLDGEDALRLARTKAGTPPSYADGAARFVQAPGAATLSRDGARPIACAPTAERAADVPSTVTASGPDWRLAIEPDRMRFAQEGGPLLIARTPTPRRVGQIATWEAEGDGASLEARLSPGPCRQPGALPTPLNAEVVANDRYYRGCSGDPATLLVGDWQVRGEEAVLAVGPASTVRLDAGCNVARGRYDVTGTTLTFGPFARTRMACPGEAGRAEERLLSFLARVDRFLVGERDELVLIADGDQLLLTRGGR